MSSNVHIFLVEKRTRRRATALDRPCAEVLRIVDYGRMSAARPTPEQRLANADVALAKLARGLLDSIVAARALQDAIRS
ncbi:hypothetical protein [Paraburkholderia sediminicola]|uniref:hypothetical protein n=1 Tax=Paraburkholderia sediminicola TaxID=458836 RepID=UPI0038B7F5EA